MVFGFTTDHATFAIPSASETDFFRKGTFSNRGLRFDVFFGIWARGRRWPNAIFVGIVTQELTDSWL